MDISTRMSSLDAFEPQPSTVEIMLRESLVYAQKVTNDLIDSMSEYEQVQLVLKIHEVKDSIRTAIADALATAIGTDKTARTVRQLGLSEIVVLHPDTVQRVCRDVLREWMESTESKKIHVRDLRSDAYKRLRQQGRIRAPRMHYMFSVYEQNIAEIHQQQKRIENLLRFKEVIAVNRGMNLKGEIITDKHFASELADRHQALNRGREIVEAIVDAQQGKEWPLSHMRSLINTHGAFLMDYDIRKEQDRLKSVNWIIARGRGEALKMGKDGLELEREASRADIQIHVPDNAPDAELYFTLPCEERGDTYLSGRGREIAAEIADNHALAGCVSDIAADDAVNSQGFASMARKTAFEYIKENRPHVRYLIAEIFSIRAAIDPLGQRIELIQPLINVASIYRHANSNLYPATPAWVMSGDRVPIYMPDGSTWHLLVDWQVLVHDLMATGSIRHQEEMHDNAHEYNSAYRGGPPR